MFFEHKPKIGLLFRVKVNGNRFTTLKLSKK